MALPRRTVPLTKATAKLFWAYLKRRQVKPKHILPVDESDGDFIGYQVRRAKSWSIIKCGINDLIAHLPEKDRPEAIEFFTKHGLRIGEIPLNIKPPRQKREPRTKITKKKRVQDLFE